MYIIGDAKCAINVKMWDIVVEILKSREQIGSRLQLHCPRHEDACLLVSQPEDFELVAPEGGCTERCGMRLDCGHACDYLCHSEERHKVLKCRKLCTRGRVDCQHSCPKRCHEPCGQCQVLVYDILLSCGHRLDSTECWIARSQSDTKAKCQVKMLRKLPRCGHEVEMLCGDNPEDFRCTENCGGILNCRHQVCGNSCTVCSELTSLPDEPKRHAPCQKLCEKNFSTCSHRCRRPCHLSFDENCGSCDQPCQIGCVHSQCAGECGQYCTPCAEPCPWQCDHLGSCTMPCGAPCVRLPCDLRCQLYLGCGHQCPSLCGEDCPSVDFCQICCREDILNVVVDFVEFTTYAEIDLCRDPIIMLPCKHFYSRSFLDGYMEINTAYTMDQNAQFAEIIPSNASTSHSKHCPECRMPISKIHRYGRVTKRALLDIMLRGMIIRSQIEYIKVSREFDELEIEFARGRETQLSKLRPVRYERHKRPVTINNFSVMSEWWENFVGLKQHVNKFLREVDEQRQPHVRVYEMAIAAADRAGSNEAGAGTLTDTPVPDIKHRILGNILELRIDIFQIEERMRFIRRLSTLEGCQDESKQLLDSTMGKCELLRVKAANLKEQCDSRQYHYLAVELLLHQLQIFQIQIRPHSLGLPLRIKLRQEALAILDDCEKYFFTYPSCEKYRPAAEAARQGLGTDTFYEHVSSDELQKVMRAMQGELFGTGHWYYCPNGHPVRPFA